MLTAIEAVSSVNTVSLLPPVARVSVLPPEAGTSFVAPSTIVSLGASSAVTDFLTYNAAGLLGSSALEATPAASLLNAGVASDITADGSYGTLEDIANPVTTVTPAVDAQLRAATDLTGEATAVEPALETLIALPATAASATATTTRTIVDDTTGNIAGLVTATSEITPDTATTTATATATAAATPQIHPAAQALNNISGNPAYAFAAASMYLSAVISRMQPIAATTRPASAADAPQPVTPVRRIMPI